MDLERAAARGGQDRRPWPHPGAGDTPHALAAPPSSGTSSLTTARRHPPWTSSERRLASLEPDREDWPLESSNLLVWTGGLGLGQAAFPVTAAGYRRLTGWLRGFGVVDRVGVEFTGALALATP